MEQPVYFWTPDIAPAGIAFSSGRLIPGWRDNLFVCALAGKHLVRLVLEGNRVVAEERLLTELDARLRDVHEGPDGALYVMTDGNEGRILRLTRSAEGRLSARCPWAGSDPLYLRYHDEEWGVPSHDDRHLFEMLILEGAQAGLSWITILRKRAAYRKAFDRFDRAADRQLRREEAAVRCSPTRASCATASRSTARCTNAARVPGRAAGVRLVRRLPLGLRRRGAEDQPAADDAGRAGAHRRSPTPSARTSRSAASPSSARPSATPSCRRWGW